MAPLYPSYQTLQQVFGSPTPNAHAQRQRKPTATPYQARKDVIAAFKLAHAKKQPDRHWVAMQKYKEAPMSWYAALLVLAFIAGTLLRATHTP